MTPDELRMLDAEVHRKVMGRASCEVRARGGDEVVTVFSDNPNILVHGIWSAEELRRYGSCPAYSADMREAWLVHLAACNWLFSRRVRYLAAIQAQADALLSEPTRAAGGSVAGLDVLVILRDRMAEVICRAALEAVPAD